MITTTLVDVHISLREHVSPAVAREVFLNHVRIMAMPPTMSFASAMENPDLKTEVRKHILFLAPNAPVEVIEAFLDRACGELAA